MANPNVCVLKADGINCDVEMSYAFEAAGATPEVVHINQLRDRTRLLGNYAILAIPGGFSYGDDINSGAVLANELTTQLSDEVQAFVAQDKPVLGVCNGFQVLVRAGLLPDGTLGRQRMTLAENSVGHFESRWIDLLVEPSACRFAQPGDFKGLQPIPMHVAHGEGRFMGRESEVEELLTRGQVVFRYSTPGGSPAEGRFPQNPNGSTLDIAGVCDPKGLILGMMPHPERYSPDGLTYRNYALVSSDVSKIIFDNIVEYAALL